MPKEVIIAIVFLTIMYLIALFTIPVIALFFTGVFGSIIALLVIADYYV